MGRPTLRCRARTLQRRARDARVVGAYGEYQWITNVDRTITDLLRLCPEVVLNRHLAVTSIDGGALHLTAEEKQSGRWTSERARIYRSTLPEGREDRADWLVAFSPLLESVHGLPNETHDECCAGFDEWYVFESNPPDCEMEVFVNWIGFRLYDPDYTWLVERFWKNIERLAPESYIAEGTVFTYATRNAGLFSRVLAAFAANAG